MVVGQYTDSMVMFVGLLLSLTRQILGEMEFENITQWEARSERKIAVPAEGSSFVTGSETITLLLAYLVSVLWVSERANTSKRSEADSTRSFAVGVSPLQFQQPTRSRGKDKCGELCDVDVFTWPIPPPAGAGGAPGSRAWGSWSRVEVMKEKELRV